MANKRKTRVNKAASKKAATPVAAPSLIVKQNRVQGAYLYPNPRMVPFNYRPRFYSLSDTYKAVTTGVRRDQITYARDLYASMSDLGSAINSKNSWAFSDAWLPRYKGTNTAWGEQVENWLKTQWYPMCNTLGQNYNFNDTLNATGISLDVDGDTLAIFNVTRNGWPLIQIVPSHRIGSRDGKTIVNGGNYDGRTIYDGVILDGNGRPIAYRILGDTQEEDLDIPVGKCQLLFEPEWADQYRGISRVARTVADWLDLQDTDEALKRSIKLAATIGLIHKTKDGLPDAGAPMIGLEEDPILQSLGIPAQQSFNIEQAIGGTMYLNANENEDISTILDERPSPNTEAFIERIQRRAIGATGWFYELNNPEKLGAASNKVIISQAREAIRKRQVTVTKRAKIMVQFAIATAMANGIIPKNYDDTWWDWHFTKPRILSINDSQEEAADRENLKLGSTTLEAIAAKQGYWWKDQREQTTKETEDLIERAVALTVKFPQISLDKALSLLSQRTPNEAPLATAPQEEPDNGAAGKPKEKQ